MLDFPVYQKKRRAFSYPDIRDRKEIVRVIENNNGRFEKNPNYKSYTKHHSIDEIMEQVYNVAYPRKVGTLESISELPTDGKIVVGTLLGASAIMLGVVVHEVALLAGLKPSLFAAVGSMGVGVSSEKENGDTKVSYDIVAFNDREPSSLASFDSDMDLEMGWGAVARYVGDALAQGAIFEFCKKMVKMTYEKLTSKEEEKEINQCIELACSEEGCPDGSS